MVKILIMTDLEGVAGVAVDAQLGGVGNPFYRKARELLAEEINAAVCGAQEAGAGECLICDGHGSGYDMMLDFERIAPGVRFITGQGGGYPYLEALDAEVAAAFLVGQHPRRGPSGALEHTGSDLVCQGAWLNGCEVGEAGLHAAVLGERGIPVALVTGDEEVVKEVAAFGCGALGVAVKRGLRRQQCVSLHPVDARRLIREAAARAVRELPALRPWRLPPPHRLRVRYGSAALAAKYAPLEAGSANPLFPYITRLDADTVEIVGSSLGEVCRRYALMNQVV